MRHLYRVAPEGSLIVAPTFYLPAAYDYYERYEQAWLDDHPASTCYESAWLTYQSGVEDVATSASAFLALATRPSPPSDAEGQQAAVSLATGTSSLDAAASLCTMRRFR